MILRLIQRLAVTIRLCKHKVERTRSATMTALPWIRTSTCKTLWRLITWLLMVTMLMVTQITSTRRRIIHITTMTRFGVFHVVRHSHTRSMPNWTRTLVHTASSTWWTQCHTKWTPTHGRCTCKLMALWHHCCKPLIRKVTRTSTVLMTVSQTNLLRTTQITVKVWVTSLLTVPKTSLSHLVTRAPLVRIRLR